MEVIIIRVTGLNERRSELAGAIGVSLSKHHSNGTHLANFLSNKVSILQTIKAKNKFSTVV